MSRFLSPIWLLLTCTLPQVILMATFWGTYQVIHPLLDLVSKSSWLQLGITTLCLTLAILGYSIFRLIHRKENQVWFCIYLIASHIAFLFLYVMEERLLIPWQIPRWMYPQDLTVYPFSLLMPGMAYALFALIIKATPEEKNKKALKNFLIALTIPAGWYLCWNIPTYRYFSFYDRYWTHVLTILFVLSNVLFLFFLGRCFFILSTKKTGWLTQRPWLWQVPICLILPLVGLVINNGVLDLPFNPFPNEKGIFGDFNHPAFYLIAFLNGCLLCFPEVTNPTLRAVLFVLKAFTLSYSLYFFAIFLVFLPLSVLIVLIFGLGFLTLAPVIVFLLHVTSLNRDLNWLVEHSYSKKKWMLLLAGCAIILPSYLTISYYSEKRVLHAALDYIYQPYLSKQEKVETGSLRNVLEHIQENKERRTSSKNTFKPVLSGFYNWLVLDNLTLSDSKIEVINKVFFDEEMQNRQNQGRQTREFPKADLKFLSYSSRFDSLKQHWVSRVELDMYAAESMAEYSTSFHLPEDCFVNDYYLFIQGKKVQGLLAEKKSAQWIYQQITSQNRDPGILFYENNTTLQLRVFPFEMKETRKTGFQILHKEPFRLTIDKYKVDLGWKRESISISDCSLDPNIVHIPTSAKKELPVLHRSPYYHFILDVSSHNTRYVHEHVAQMKYFMRLHPNAQAQVSMVSTHCATYPFSEYEKAIQDTPSSTGGFFLERALKQIASSTYSKADSTYPVLIVMSKSNEKAIFTDNNLHAYDFCFPEGFGLYQLNKGNSLSALDLPDFKSKNVEQGVRVYSDKSNKKHFIPNNEQPSLVLLGEPNPSSEKMVENAWDSGLLLWGMRIQEALHPENGDKAWKELLKGSFTSKILQPVTSYIVLENEAQRLSLIKKQEEVLSGKKSLDLEEEPQRMSEPWFVFVIVILFILFKIFKKQLSFSNSF